MALDGAQRHVAKPKFSSRGASLGVLFVPLWGTLVMRSAHFPLQGYAKMNKPPTRRPPAISSVISNCPTITDTGYALGIHLHGIEGTWHRLWAIIILTFEFGDDIETNDSVATVRNQFEQILGRAMTTNEWDALVAHAMAAHN